MAGLIDFRVTFVPNRYGDQLQRRVGLLPLTGPICAGKGLEGDVATKTLRVVDQWRTRVQSLGNAGWSPFAGDGEKAARDRTYAANCVPAFAAVEGYTRHCGRSPCLFCWSRWALEIWEATNHALFASPEALRTAGADGGKKLTVSPFDLILWSTSNAFPRRRTGDETGDDGDTLPGVLRRQIDGRGGWCRSVAAEMGVLGGLHLSTITPDGPAWRGGTSRLLIIPAGVEPHAKWCRPAAKGARSLVRTYRRPTRKDVLGAVARACRYPKSWMTCKPEDLIAILDARSNLKLSATFGLLRNRSARAREEAAANRPGR